MMRRRRGRWPRWPRPLPYSSSSPPTTPAVVDLTSGVLTRCGRGRLKLRPELWRPVDPVTLGSRCHEDRQKRRPQDLFPDAAAGEPANPMKTPGSKNDCLALPAERLIDNSLRHAILQRGARPSLCCDLRRSQRPHCLANQILGFRRRFEWENACHFREFPDVQNPDAGLVGRRHVRGKGQSLLAGFKLINCTQQSVPHVRTSNAHSMFCPWTETEREQSPAWN